MTFKSSCLDLQRSSLTFVLISWVGFKGGGVHSSAPFFKSMSYMAPIGNMSGQFHVGYTPWAQESRARMVPVFWVIWRLVIICLHLGSINSLFLFCFKHCNMVLESASGQNRCKENKIIWKKLSQTSNYSICDCFYIYLEFMKTWKLQTKASVGARLRVPCLLFSLQPTFFTFLPANTGYILHGFSWLLWLCHSRGHLKSAITV